ncbi:hypothetical protein ABG752_10105 [Streptococcus iniae]
MRLISNRHIKNTICLWRERENNILIELGIDDLLTDRSLSLYLY